MPESAPVTLGEMHMKEELIAGVDEVGWGSPAGPLVSCVVVMKESDKLLLPKGVTDSKRVSPKKREAFFLQLTQAVTSVGLGVVDAWEIDKLSPKFALQESYTRALNELTIKPDRLIVDGTDWTNLVQSWKGKQVAIPKADLHHIEVSTASIIAKVFRDTVMGEIEARLKRQGLPGYNLGTNMGYLTKDHQLEIDKYGLMFGPEHEYYIHRRSYCSNMLGKVPIWKPK
jgi:ribonuclease HII